MGHQSVEHARRASQIVGQKTLFGDVAEDSFPADELAGGVNGRHQGIAQPAGTLVVSYEACRLSKSFLR